MASVEPEPTLESDPNGKSCRPDQPTAARLPNSLPSIDVSGGVAAAEIANLLSAPMLRNHFRNDLIDVGKSIGHRGLFGEATRSLGKPFRQGLVNAVYRPYRQNVRMAIERLLQADSFVVHLSVRSFPAKRAGNFLRTDIGLLYDPAREHEADLCIDWIDEVYFSYADLKIRRNFPRRGTVDSLTRHFRHQFDPNAYLGIEVWLNRAWLTRKCTLRDEALWQFARGLRATLDLAESDAA